MTPATDGAAHDLAYEARVCKSCLRPIRLDNDGWIDRETGRTKCRPETGKAKTHSRPDRQGHADRGVPGRARVAAGAAARTWPACGHYVGRGSA